MFNKPRLLAGDLPRLDDLPRDHLVNYIGDGLQDAFDPYKVIEKAGEY